MRIGKHTLHMGHLNHTLRIGHMAYPKGRETYPHFSKCMTLLTMTSRQAPCGWKDTFPPCGWRVRMQRFIQSRAT